MKKEEIEVGKTYHNGKTGRSYQERQIIGQGADFKLYSSQAENDCFRYRVVKGGRANISEGNITRVAMATWAKGIVDGS